MTYAPQPETDHEGKGLAKLLDQFKTLPVFAGFIGPWLRQIQKLEDAAWEVILIRGIEASSGVGLDAIGKIVGRQRLGLADPDYKIALRAKIRINRSSGRPNDLIDVAVLSLPQTGFSVLYSEYYPATVQIEVLGLVDFTVAVLFDNLFHAKAGGVKLFLTWAVQAPEDSFTFAPPGDVVVNDPLAGFADTGQTTGGHLTAVQGS